MAKTERLTKKRVLELFSSVKPDLHKLDDFKTADRVLGPNGLANWISEHRTALTSDRRGEAGERELVDAVVRDLNGIFGDEIREIVTQQANARFFYARAQAEKSRLERISAIYEDVLEENQRLQGIQEGNKKKQETALGNYNAQIAAEQQTIDAVNAELSPEEVARRRAELAEELKAARLRDQAEWYANYTDASGKKVFVDAYIGKGIKSWFRKLPTDPQAIVDALGPKAAEMGIICPHTDEARGRRQPGKEELEVEAAIEAYELRIAETRPRQQGEAEGRMELSTELKNKVESQLEKTKGRIKFHEDEMTHCRDNIAYLATQGLTETEFADAAAYDQIAIDERRRLSMVAFAQRELDNLNADPNANPLAKLAYEAFIDNLQEQERILEDFKETRTSWFPLSKKLEDIEDQQVVDTLQRDLNLANPQYMEIALEHYLAAAYAQHTDPMARLPYEDRAYAYFNRYIPGLRGREGKFAEISSRVAAAERAAKTFVDHALALDISKHPDAVIEEQQITERANMLTKRLEATHHRLEVIHPDYDRLQRYTQNPALARFMALTMMREEIISIQRGVAKDDNGNPIAFTEEHEKQLAAVGKEMEAVIEATKTEGTFIDLEDAASIAVETLIPGYDQIREFAEMQYPKLDLSNPVHRARLLTLEGKFQIQLQMNNINTIAPDKMIAYMKVMGVDTSKQENIDAYIAENREGILEYFSNGGVVYPQSIAQYADVLKKPSLLANDPEKLAEIYKAFNSPDLQVAYDPATKQFTLHSEGKDPVIVPPHRLASAEFMKAMGMMYATPADKELHAAVVADTGLSIKAFIDRREAFVRVAENGQDNGQLGHTTFALNTEISLATAREALFANILDSSEAWEATKAQIIADTKAVPTSSQIRAELHAKYAEEYAKLLDEYRTRREEVEKYKASKTKTEEAVTTQDPNADPSREPVDPAPKTTVVTSKRTYSTEKRMKKDGTQAKGSQKTLESKFFGKDVRDKTTGEVAHKDGFVDAIKQFGEPTPETAPFLQQALASAFGATLTYINNYDLAPEVIEALNEKLKESGLSITATQLLDAEGNPVVDAENNPVSTNSIVRTLEDGSTQTFSLNQEGRVNVETVAPVKEAAQGDE